MVTAEVTDVQQVTTRAKGKTTEWETQEAIRKQAVEWIQKANEWNVAELRQQRKPLDAPIETTDDDSTWHALQEWHIMLPLGSLLQLVPQFTEGLKSVITAQNSEPTPAFFSSLEEGPAIVDTSSPTIMAIIKGK